MVGAFCDRQSTKSLAAGLGGAFTVYEYDRRGRGDSGEAGPYSVGAEVGDLAAMIEAAGGSAFVYGHSSGAALALEAAAAGLPIRKLAVYEPPYTGVATQEFQVQLAALAAAGRHSEAAETMLRLMGTPGPVVDQMKVGPYWPRMASFAPTLAYELACCSGGTVLAERLARISVDALALAGGASGPWAEPAVRAVAAATPGAEVLVVEGQGHGVADEAIIPVLLRFFLAPPA